ncbi:hypothetical protein GCM10011491_34660 [Brucella endophytica]|uniref:Uncharacterized protein n=1 Tax=Brucella endophytica TaxID=1963359 RepID=A0A916WIL5_9HYPH|nr:hypothetical protein [Brucella endophytica]GGB03556.1 hypothetical protein GCM10011491_34660 [Brucella endophytica]
MARKDLSKFTPAELKAYKNEQARLRMKKMRGKEKQERELAKASSILTPTSPDVIEFVTEIEMLPLAAKVELVAAWEREYKQRLPVEPVVKRLPGETFEDYQARDKRHRDLVLAKMFAADFYARQKAAARKKAYDARQAAEAARLGITVSQLQYRRKMAAWKAEKEASQRSRELERLARRAST